MLDSQRGTNKIGRREYIIFVYVYVHVCREWRSFVGEGPASGIWRVSHEWRFSGSLTSGDLEDLLCRFRGSLAGGDSKGLS